MKFLVTKPWNFEVNEGDVVEFATLHDSLVAHVVAIPEGALEVATPMGQPESAEVVEESAPTGQPDKPNRKA